MKINFLENKSYRGKHIIMIANKVYTATTGKNASKLFDKLTKKYPDKTPTITYIPKNDTLILWKIV